MTDQPELLPCPFCGGQRARTVHIRDGRKAACVCGACGKPEFNGPLAMPSAEDRAITAWNTRAPNPRIERLEAINAELVAALDKIMPARVQDGPDYAEVYFSDGQTHSTQAMTVNPQDWTDLQAAYERAKREGGSNA